MIVLDASAWVAVLAGHVDVPALAEEPVAVPPHFDAEVAGALRALTQRGALTQERAGLCLDRHLRAPFERLFSADDLRTAWEWRESMSLPDAWYAALARRLHATWVTSDQRAARRAGAHHVEVALV